MNIFISQPMRDREDADILDERHRIIEWFKQKHPEEDIHILDSFIVDAPKRATPLWWLGRSLEVLSQADFAIFAPESLATRGCLLEHLACEYYDIDHIHTISDESGGFVELEEINIKQYTKGA